VTSTDAACQIVSEGDLLAVRALLRSCARAAGLGVVDETKIITAGSELARNILRYAGARGGALRVEIVAEPGRTGVRAVFSDEGPGIADVERALRDGYSTAGSLGLGLPGTRRLVDDFAIESVPGRGTVVTVIKWASR
jgi:serine/threonine-protein kinase RsbT